ncbi:hypothetical protein GCM10018780_38410 [Streptomyces lanatus]|nr:hypothetical protein GCM10018780_38410 [Streptomyces lanatus]
MDHAAQRAQFAHRMLQGQPEDLAFRDTWGHRAEQRQPSVHVADLTGPRTAESLVRKILTPLTQPDRRNLNSQELPLS